MQKVHAKHGKMNISVCIDCFVQKVSHSSSSYRNVTASPHHRVLVGSPYGLHIHNQSQLVSTLQSKLVISEQGS